MKRPLLLLPLRAFAASIVASLATSWCFRRDPVSFPPFFWTVFLVYLILELPFVLLGIWAWRRRRAGKRGAGALRAVSLLGTTAALVFAGWIVYEAAPLHDAIIARGVTPNGRDYVVSRAWQDWTDGHDVRWFAREGDGRWRSIWGGRDWHVGYRIAEIVFDEPYPAWHSDGTPFFRLSSGTAWYLQEDPDRPEFLPASMTPEDLHEWHRGELAERRAYLQNLPRGAVAPARKNPATPSPAEEKHAESAETAEPGGGSGEAQPPPVESHAKAAEGAE